MPLDEQSLEYLARLENEEMIASDEEDETETQGASESSTLQTQATQTVPNSKKRKTSLVWKEFKEVGIEVDGKRRSRCTHCDKKIVTELGQGTTSMKRHLECCPKRAPGMSDKREYDHRVDRKMMTEIIIYHDQPFRYVEYEKVRARDRYLNPNCQHICRQTAGADVFRRYEFEKEKLKKVFAEYKGRFCFTADMWTARATMKGYLCLTAHYVDDSWNLNNKILAFCDVSPPHTGENLSITILSCLKEWGLEKKVFTMTLDNATSNDSMQKLLLHRLQAISGNGLLCDGKYFHVRCCAHILNLIVQQGLELANSLLEKIRDSVKFVRASPLREEAFKACSESVGNKSAFGLSLDVRTRWNSTYNMLFRALKFRDAFASYKECDRSYKSLPSDEEWERGDKICNLLKPFSTITTYFSGVKYPTANAYFMQVWKIECVLRKFAACGDSEVEDMVRPMQSKFAKYWDEYSLILAMAAVLDPRMKLQILEQAYQRVDPRTSKKKIEVVKKNLKELYADYKSKSWTSSSANLTPRPAAQSAYDLLTESPLEDDTNFDLFELEKSTRPDLNNTKSNLDLYLEEPRQDVMSFTYIEVLDYWKKSGQRYGDLAGLACILLSIPVTTVASESAFSIGGRVLNPYRNRLLPKNVQALLCTRNWLRGFADFEGDIEDFFEDEKDNASNVASSSGV